MRFDLVYIALGAILGAPLRYFIGGKQLSIYGLPISVLIINILGSFILGATMTGAEKFGLDGRYVLFLGVGFCGSFTTMSSFAYETVSLADAGKLLFTILNVTFNVGFSLVAIVAGRAVTLFLL